MDNTASTKSENPRVLPMLNRENFHRWSRSLKMDLISKNILGFIEGTIPAPPRGDSLYPMWEFFNDLVVSLISSSIPPSITERKDLIGKNKSAAEIWAELEKRFTKCAAIRVAELQVSIGCFKQGKLSLTDYFNELKIMWDELESLRRVPECTNCETFNAVEMYKRQDRVIRFVTGLNHSYASLKRHILRIDPLPPLKVVFSMVVERGRELFGNKWEPASFCQECNWAVDYQLPVTKSWVVFKSGVTLCTTCGRNSVAMITYKDMNKA